MATSTSPEHTCISICASPPEHDHIRALARRILRRTTPPGPPPALVEVDDDSFAAAVAGPLPVLIVVSTRSCEPCRQLGLSVEQAASEFTGRLKVVTVNVDDAPTTAKALGVQVVPTLFVLHDGGEVAHRVGTLSAPALTDWLLDVLPAAA
jgi:thioredoxin-like negative regulator of GroEL